MRAAKRDEELKKIKDEVVACQKCSLCKTRVLPVIGEGSHRAKIMLIGEAPGANEAQTGHPFCGRSGQVLTEILEISGIKRKNVYICNILKDRPPGNRNPQDDEIIACTPYLERQINIIKPKILCAMGNYATNFILKKFGLKDEIKGISQIHGQVFETKADFGAIKIASLYHPAVAVYNQNMKTVLEDDFKKLLETIKKSPAP